MVETGVIYQADVEFQSLFAKHSKALDLATKRLQGGGQGVEAPA